LAPYEPKKLRDGARVNKTKPINYTPMKMSKWTQVLLSAGLVSLPAVAQADAPAAAPQPNSVLTSLSATTLSGYIDTAAIWKFGTGNANMPGRVYDGSDVQDGFNMNLVSLTLEKPLDESEWAAGYHVQMLMGPWAAKRGTGLLSSFSTTEFSFNEAYINLRVPLGNGLELHLGQFGTFNGFEAFDTYKNPNWSRSYGFFNETSAHTGLAAFYKFSDCLTVQAGVGNVGPFNSQIDARGPIESQKAYLAMATLTAPESFGFLKGATLSAGYTTGPHVTGGQFVDQIYVGGTIPLPITCVSLGYAYDYTGNLGAFATGNPAVTGGYANAVAGYIMWQATEKLKINTRLDYATGTRGWYGPTAPHRLGSLTVTADYSLWKNVISRAELRWDHALDGTKAFGGTIVGVGHDKDAVSLNMNVIYQF
jgi:Putative beta-barrel porin-2, OmpL-like. bbp2